MSLPGQKPRPAPVTTMARTAGSASASSSTSKYRISMASFHAFMRAGRLSITVATPSLSTSYRTTSSTGPSAKISLIGLTLLGGSRSDAMTLLAASGGSGGPLGEVIPRRPIPGLAGIQGRGSVAAVQPDECRPAVGGELLGRDVEPRTPGHRFRAGASPPGGQFRH